MRSARTGQATPRRPSSNDSAENASRRRVPLVTATIFTGGVIWTGSGDQTDALLVADGVVQALGDEARASSAEVDVVDLAGGFLMPSFGDGHAHPLYGGLEFVGPAVRPCGSVDEIVSAVGEYAAQHPDDEW